MGHDSLQPELGARLRALRRERGLKLSDVSESTGISSSFLSLVESGKNDLTISRLARLCQFYRLSVVDVLPELGQHDAVVLRHGQQRGFLSPAEGIAVSLLAPDAQRLMLPVRMDFDPGGRYAELAAHGAELFLVVVEGRIEVAGDALEPLLVEEGDTIYLKAGHRHSLRNPDERVGARSIVVFSPPAPAGPALDGNGDTGAT